MLCLLSAYVPDLTVAMHDMKKKVTCGTMQWPQNSHELVDPGDERSSPLHEHVIGIRFLFPDHLRPYRRPSRGVNGRPVQGLPRD